ATSYVANNLNTNTRYYWKIIPYTEGNTRTIQVLTDSTRCSMKGVYKIGAGGNFNSIRSAQDSLALWGMEDAITWELLSAFSFASENLPIQFKSLAPCHEKNYTLTIRPAAGAGFSFISNSASPVFLIDSSKNIIIEGRAGGGGPGALILEGSGELIKIRNGWNNQINFIEFKSNSASSTISPLSIEGTAGGGSYLNSINNCVLHDRGSSFSLPLQLIRSVISNGAPNYNNIISGCNFYNFKRFALDIDGKGWTVKDNSFYGTVPINATDSSGFINISTNDNTLQNQITGNYFGGSGPNCSGNVLTWNSSWFFNGIGVNANSMIKDNQFRRIKITTAPTLPTPDSYIDLVRVGKFGSGSVTIDFTIQKNQFGGLSPEDSISLISNTPSSVKTTMIRAAGASVGVVDSNSMVYIHTSVAGSNPDVSLNLVENLLGNTITIKNNVVGTAQHSYRIVHRGSGMMTAFYTWGRATMTDNLITNIVARNKVAGIMTQLDSYIDPSLNGTITGNTISHLKSLESVPGFDNYSAVGIATYGSAVLIERNKILHIEDSSMLLGPIGAVSIFSKDCNNTISRNLIDGLLQNQVVPYSKYMKALSMEDDRSVIMNNMIRLGVDSAGNAVPGASFIGYTNTSTTTNRVIHNSFYITGNGGSSPANISYCISYTGPSNFVNNILVNNRPNPTGSVNAIFSNSPASQTNYTDYNVCYHVPNGIFALSSSGNLSFQQWMGLGKDVQSVLAQPNYVSPDGPTRLLNLHVAAPTPVDHRGTSFGSYTTTYDYDGDVRANLSPVDIGADAVTDVVVTAVTNINGLEYFRVFPNPNNGLFVIKMKLSTVKEVSFRLYNSLGEAIYQSQVYHFYGAQQEQINRTNLASGVYFLETRIGKESFIQKIFISR
ncbi:MAG TPA: T9SS type A sorting domain-containing protein, partial [Chitinophagaceae bacterium]|nr:T9SS type A sorting domain-containing protein [Chitinophagaceae bacterium]